MHILKNLSVDLNKTRWSAIRYEQDIQKVIAFLACTAQTDQAVARRSIQPVYGLLLFTF
jgi:hypothetical protein